MAPYSQTLEYDGHSRLRYVAAKQFRSRDNSIGRILLFVFKYSCTPSNVQKLHNCCLPNVLSHALKWLATRENKHQLIIFIGRKVSTKSRRGGGEGGLNQTSKKITSTKNNIQTRIIMTTAFSNNLRHTS